MSQLHHIVGAILRDIAQSRVTSDLYSREISQYYEKDSLLRLFPVPRSEIKEVEFDLKFAFSGVSIDPDRKDVRDTKIAQIFEEFAEAIPGDIFENLRGSEKIRKIDEWVTLVNAIEESGVRLELQTFLIEFFDAAKGTLLTITENEGKVDINFDMDRTREGILATIERLIYSRNDILEMAKKYSSKRLWPSVKTSVSNGFRDQLNDMNEAFEFLEAAEEYKVEIDVTSGALTELPPESLSSLRVVTEIRNYSWSQVEERDNKKIRRLIPE